MAAEKTQTLGAISSTIQGAGGFTIGGQLRCQLQHSSPTPEPHRFGAPYGVEARYQRSHYVSHLRLGLELSFTLQ